MYSVLYSVYLHIPRVTTLSIMKVLLLLPKQQLTYLWKIVYASPETARI